MNMLQKETRGTAAFIPELQIILPGLIIYAGSIQNANENHRSLFHPGSAKTVRKTCGATVRPAREIIIGQWTESIEKKKPLRGASGIFSVLIVDCRDAAFTSAA